MDLLAAFRAFVRVAESGSFSAVAREMGVTQPAVSRLVGALESHLGARLLQRTTRSLALTEDGRELLEPARAALDAAERAEGAVGRRHAGPSGIVRIAAPVVFGRVLVAPLVHRLLERHPALSVDLVLSDRVADLVHDGIDVALRVGEVPDTSLIARRIGAFRRLLVASTGYLDRHGTPRLPADLPAHACILVNSAGHSDTWRLLGPDGPVEVRVSGRFRTDSAEAARAAVRTDLGIAVISGWLMQRELRDGSVRRVLDPWHSAPVPVHAVYPSQRFLAPRTRAVIDFLVDEFRSDPALGTLLHGAGA